MRRRMSLARSFGFENADEMMTFLVFGKEKHFGSYQTNQTDHEAF